MKSYEMIDMGWKRLPSKHLVQGQTRLLRAVPSQVLKAPRDGDGTWAACPNLQGKAISLHQTEHLISASHPLSTQIQVPSSATLPVHKCPERTHFYGSVNVQTHSHMCKGTATQHTGMHTSEDFIYKFMAWNTVLSKCKPQTKSGTVCVTERRKAGGFPQRFFMKFCTKLWFIMGQETTLYKEENCFQILA